MERTKYAMQSLGSVFVLLTLWVAHVVSVITHTGDGMKLLVAG